MTSEAAKSPVPWVFLALSLLFQVTAVILGKAAALRLGHPSVSAFLSNPWYLGGMGCLFLQAICWQLVLRQVQLFVAYLVTSLNYLIVLAASRIFFDERVSLLNIIGSAVIVCGVYIIINERRA